MNGKVYAIVAATMAAGLIGGLGWLALGRSGEDVAAQCGAGQVGAEIGGPFELVNAAGETVTDADVITEPSLVYFGYTFCPDVCPLDTVRNADAVDLLAARGHEVQPVFISVDPARDTPEAVGQFAENISPEMVALTGSEAQVQAASQAYRTYYRRHDGEDDEFYLVDHSTFTYLVLPGQGVRGVLRRELTAEQVADTVACVLDAT
jgi:protein SCO1/2